MNFGCNFLDAFYDKNSNFSIKVPVHLNKTITFLATCLEDAGADDRHGFCFFFFFLWWKMHKEGTYK